MHVEDLVEFRAIEHLKYRYLRAVDLRLWDELADTLTEGATASYGGGAMTPTGREEIVEFMRSRLPTQVITSHTVHHPELELTGPGEATGRWALNDVVIDQRFDLTIRGAAVYEDRYVKQDGTWRIAHTGYRRMYEELEPRKAPDDGGPTMTAHWWDTDGRSSLQA